MNFPVFDLHCDTALALLGESVNEAGSLRKNELHIDLERAKAYPGYCQCFACFTTPMMEEWYHVTPTLIFERELVTIQRELDKNGDLMEIAYSASDIEEHRQAGKMSAVLTIEGPAGFGFDPELLENLYQIGFRISTLGWNEKNPLAGSHRTGGGLTDMGRAYVKEAQRLGMGIDVSHISDEAFWDIMKITEKPVIATHSSSRAVWDSSRNLTDDMFRAIAETGGVAGINLYESFLGKEGETNIDTVCDHIFHFLELDSEGKHIALGGDLDGCNPLVGGFGGVQGYAKLADRLRKRGLTDEIIMNIFWNNAIGVI